MGYSDDQLAVLNSMYGDYQHTRPKKGRQTSADYYAEQEEKLHWSIDQGVSRGLISYQAAEEAKVGNERSWWDRMFGFEEASQNMMGAVAQPVIDVLSLGTYSAAAATQATMKDPLIQMGSLKIGFTPKAWYDAFKKRPYYSEMTETFAGGLVYDIALDPLTYLTFGVGPGLKVGVGGAKMIGKKAVPEGARKLTLTRHGQEVYNIAAQRMRPAIDEAFETEAELSKAAGQTERRWLGPEAMFRIHDGIGELMVSQYDSLAADLQKQKGRWDKFKSSIAGEAQNVARAGTDTSYLGRNAEDMFQETASLGTREHGINFREAGKKLSNMYGIGKVWKAVAPNFHRKLNVPNDVQEVWMQTKGAINRQEHIRLKALDEALGGLSHQDLVLATKMLEAGDEHISRMHDPLQESIMKLAGEDGTYMPPEVTAAALWARDRLQAIIDEETKLGFKTGSVMDYVMQNYRTRDARKLILSNIDRNPGVANYSNRGSFAFHRMIAGLEELDDVLGAGLMEQNLGLILAKREAFSVRMVEMEKFYEYVKLTSGISSVMIYQAGNEGKLVANMLAKILKSATPSENRIYQYDQVMSMDGALHNKLNFISDTDAYKSGGSTHNLNLLDYLRMDPVDRGTAAGAKLTSEVRPNNLAQLRKKFDPTFKLQKSTAGTVSKRELDINEILRAEYEGSLDGIGIFDMAGAWFGKTPEELTVQDLGLVFKAMDRHFRKELDTPLMMLFPDIVDRVMKEAGKRSGKLGKNTGELRKGAQEAKDVIVKNLQREVAAYGSFVPQLPEEFILRAKMTRMNYGDFTDVSLLSDNQRARIIKLQKQLGLKSEHMEELMHALLERRSINNVSGRGADKLIEFMSLHAGGDTARKASTNGHLFNTGVREVTFSQQSRPHFAPVKKNTIPSLEAAEEMTLAETKRAAAWEKTDRIIKRLTKRGDDLKKEIAEKEAFMKGFGGKESPLSIGHAKLLGKMKDDLKNNNARLDEVSKLRASHSTAVKQPPLQADTRKFVPNEDVLARNADRLTDADVRSITSKSGLSRKTKDVRQLMDDTPGSALDQAFKARQAVATTVKGFRKKIQELTAAREYLVENHRMIVKGEIDPTPNEFGFGMHPQDRLARHHKALDKIDQEIKDYEGTIEDTIVAAMDKVDGQQKIKILPGGRYLDENGKVQDIIIREKKDGKGWAILGKDEQKIKSAIAADMIKTGRNEIEFLTPVARSEIPDTVVGTAAAKYYIPEDVARFLEDLNTPTYSGRNDMIDGFLRNYDRIQNLYKVPLLGPWFSTMARNGIGNVSLNYLRAGISLLEPEYLTDFMRVLMYALASESPAVKKVYMSLHGKKGAAKLAELGKQEVRYLGSDLGVPMTVNELTQEMGKRGVFTAAMREEIFDTDAGSWLSQKTGGAAAGAFLGGSVGGPLGALGGFGVGALLGKESYRMNNLFRAQELASEIPTRMMLALHTFKKTGSMDEAGRVVRHQLHDYSELSTFEKRYMRRAIPFYNFTKMAFRVFGTEIFEHPGRVMLPQKVFNAQNVNGTFADSKAMPEDVPDWFHRQMVFMGKDIDEETGKAKTWVYGGFNLPLQEVLQLTDILAPGGRNITEMGSRGSFLATTTLEYLLNYDTFRGGPIYPDVSSGVKQTPWESGNAFKGSPEWMKTLVGFHEGDDGKAKVNPRMAWLLGEIPTSRFTSLAKKIYEAEDSEVKKFNMPALAQSLIGISQYRYDPDTQSFFQNKKKVEAMTTLLTNIQALKSYNIDRSTFDTDKAGGTKKKTYNPLAGYGALK